jgi:hypothetical protein
MRTGRRGPICWAGLDGGDRNDGSPGAPRCAVYIPAAQKQRHADADRDSHIAPHRIR